MQRSYQTPSGDSIARGEEPDEAPELNTIIVEDDTMRAGFVMLPTIILRGRGLSAGAKVAYGLLLHYAWQAGSCFPGQSRMAEDLETTRQAVGRHIAELVAAGAVIVRRRGQGKTNVYVLPRLSSPIAAEKKPAKSDVTKVKHQEVTIPDVTKTEHLEVTPARHQDVTKIEHNIYPGKRDSGNRRRSPQPPVGGPVRQRRRRRGEDPDRFITGAYGLCQNCLARPCMCEVT
ncbi:MAG: hypothetical protein JWP44_4513 [Mucilaginibacter sp.]|nr:hypothetical protein [Mucilaginibacter sp.]